MNTIEHTTTIVVIECGKCGVTFGLSESFIKARREDHATWYCPNGDGRHYPAKSEAEKLQDQLAAEKRRRGYVEATLTHTRDQLQATEYQRRAQKGANTKLKKRIAAGVCPCCNRTFQNVARHISGQHPNYAPTVEDQS